MDGIFCATMPINAIVVVNYDTDWRIFVLRFGRYRRLWINAKHPYGSTIGSQRPEQNLYHQIGPAWCTSDNVVFHPVVVPLLEDHIEQWFAPTTLACQSHLHVLFFDDINILIVLGKNP